MKYYVTLVATLVAQKKTSDRHIIQIVLGDPDDIINQTQGLSQKDMMTLTITQPLEGHIGERIHLKGLLELNSSPPKLSNESQSVEKMGYEGG